MEYYETAFPEKLKALRKAYKIRGLDLIDYCQLFTKDYMSKHSITFWENKKSEPSFKDIKTISNFFCVSLEWLCMPSNYPQESIYDIIKIRYFENRNMTVPYFQSNLPEKYFDEKIREELPLEARANIITLSFIFYRKGKNREEGLKSLEDIKEIIETKKPKFIVKR